MRVLAFAGPAAAHSTHQPGHAGQSEARNGTLRLLAGVVDIVDASTGTVRLRAHADAADEMALDTAPPGRSAQAPMRANLTPTNRARRAREIGSDRARQLLLVAPAVAATLAATAAAAAASASTLRTDSAIGCKEVASSAWSMRRRACLRPNDRGDELEQLGGSGHRQQRGGACVQRLVAGRRRPEPLDDRVPSSSIEDLMTWPEAAGCRRHDAGSDESRDDGVPRAHPEAPIETTAHRREHGLGLRSGFGDDLTGGGEEAGVRSVIEVELGHEEAGQARVQIVPGAESVSAGVGIERDEREFLGEQHDPTLRATCPAADARWPAPQADAAAARSSLSTTARTSSTARRRSGLRWLPRAQSGRPLAGGRRRAPRDYPRWYRTACTRRYSSARPWRDDQGCLSGHCTTGIEGGSWRRLSVAGVRRPSPDSPSSSTPHRFLATSPSMVISVLVCSPTATVPTASKSSRFRRWRRDEASGER